MVQLANGNRVIAIVLEMLWQSNDVRLVGPKVNMVSCDADRVWPQTGHQAGSGRIANGLLTVSSIKPHSTFGQSINVWRSNNLASETSKIRAQIIDCNKKDIGFFAACTLLSVAQSGKSEFPGSDENQNSKCQIDFHVRIFRRCNLEQLMLV